ncbi:hypothetical protein [Sphingomonas sp. MMS24-J13]|uniref:hypothetical protein n=1 Tax=Sphingomonas sp. MMS24-J13 TaxID=3238686 RepID=UPI00384ECFC5
MSCVIDRAAIAASPPSAPDEGTARWHVEGLASTQSPLRILGLLAQRDRLFTSCEARVEGDALSMTIAVDHIAVRDAELIAERMRGIVGVARVALDWTVRRAA